MNNAKLYLCKADCSILGTISGLKVETCNLTRNALDLWEITFEVDRFIDKDGKLVQSDYYDSIDEMMRLYLDSETIQAFFVIDSEPTVHGEDLQEVKTITAHSIECELGNIPLKNLKINCGTYDSQEYLIKFSEPKLVLDKDGNPMLDRDGKEVYTDNNLNPYTGLPYEYISLVNYDTPKLSLMHIVLDGTGWTLEDNIPSEICNIKKSYDTSESVYAFLMKQVSPASDVIFQFDRKHKKINIISVNEYGKDTGVFITMRNLMNSFEVTSSSEDSIVTKLIPKGANDLSVLYVNFGEDYIINLDYFMNTLNEYGDYKYVSKELSDKYNAWKNCRYVEKVDYEDKEYTRRELYSELSRKYNKTILDISELHNRLPNDGCVIDYKTFSLEELKTSLTAYENALNALITAYKDEYGVTDIGIAPDYSPTPSNSTNIKNTPYWYDFYAYQEKIIPQVKEALKMYCKTDVEGNLVFDEDGHYIELEYGNQEYYKNDAIVKNIDAYLYQWELYGLDELESKKKAWSEVSSVLFKEYYVSESDEDGNPKSYISIEDWDELTDEQKLEFTSKDAFVKNLNSYLDYMSFDERENGLTGTVCKGIIRQCEEAINERKFDIDEIHILQNEYQSQRKELSEDVALEKFFAPNELFVIKGMLKEQEYNNENILVTNLNNIAKDENKPYQDEIDIQEELYQASLKELDKLSQPQYSFSTELDNLYSLEEFKSYRKPFDVGNFIRVGLQIHENLYNNDYIKLRLISITNNPLIISEELSVEFSTMTKTLNTISDLSFLLDKELSSGGSTSSTSSNSSGGTYGNNDANVQISNNMLNALLSTETFGTAVNDVILDSMKANKGNFNTLFSHSGVFDSLETGQFKVSGDCLFDRIKSNNWNGKDEDLLGNTEGSIIDLYDGKFSFAGGNLKWDNSELSVKGKVIADSFVLGQNANITAGNDTEDKSESYYDLDSSGTLTANNAVIHGTINAIDGNFTGDIVANTLTANEKGSIAGWQFNDKAFYKNYTKGIDDITNINDIIIGSKEWFYIGEDGISIGDYFVVDSSGMKSQNVDMMHNIYDSRIGFNSLEMQYTDTIKLTIQHLNIDDNIGVEVTAYYYYGTLDSDYGSVSVSKNYEFIVSNNITISDGLTATYNDDTNEVTVNIPCSTILNYKADGYGTRRKPNNLSSIYIYKESFTKKGELREAVLINNNKEIIQKFDGTLLYKNYGLIIDTINKKISGDRFDLVPNKFDSYGNFSFNFYTDISNTSDTVVTLNYSGFKHKNLYNEKSLSNKRTLYIGSDGVISAASSSRRYKQDITTELDEIFNPRTIYDLPVCQFRYNSENGGGDSSPLYLGFIAEDVAKYYPHAARWNKEHTEVDTWEISDMFPALVKLIQEQHQDIEKLKQEIENIKNNKVSK